MSCLEFGNDFLSFFLDFSAFIYEAMSDPLSVSASIAGLVTITDAVFCRAFKYVKAVKGASNEVANLASAIGSLSGILHNLHLLACQLEGETFDTTIQTHHLHSCYQTVEKVRKILDKFDVSSTAHGLDTMKRLRWPFSVPEAKNLTSEVERHKTTLSVALAADGLSGLLQALSRQKDLQTGVDDIKSELKRKREVETHLTISEERRKILAWIQKHDPHQNHDMALRLRHPGTGLWLLESEEVCQFTPKKPPEPRCSACSEVDEVPKRLTDVRLEREMLTLKFVSVQILVEDSEFPALVLCNSGRRKNSPGVLDHSRCPGAKLS